MPVSGRRPRSFGGTCKHPRPTRSSRNSDSLFYPRRPAIMETADSRIIWFTLGVSLLATLLILPPGIAIAWLLARKNWPGKSLLETLVMLPLVLPPVATGLILLKLFGRRGPLGAFLEKNLDLEIVFTWRGVL